MKPGQGPAPGFLPGRAAVMALKKRLLAVGGMLLTGYVSYVAVDISLYATVNEMKKAGAAIVLGAGVAADKPSPIFEERINHAIWLYKNGYVDKIILTGGKSKKKERSESSIARKYALSKTVPFKDIYIEEQSVITQENIFYAARIMKNADISSVIIVSDPLHMKRAMLMARDNGLTAYSSPTPTTKYVSLKTKLPFLAREIFFYIGYKIVRCFQFSNNWST